MDKAQSSDVKSCAAQGSSSEFAERRFAARVAAVQAVYESLMTNINIKDVVSKALEDKVLSVDDEDGALDVKAVATPEKGYFSGLAQGVFNRKKDLDAIIHAHKNNPEKTFEPLLQAILLCAGWELLEKGETDPAVIINDYLDVTHSFYDKNEVSLVNGILDAMASNLRPS